MKMNQFINLSTLYLTDLVGKVNNVRSVYKVQKIHILSKFTKQVKSRGIARMVIESYKRKSRIRAFYYMIKSK